MSHRCGCRKAHPQLPGLLLASRGDTVLLDPSSGWPPEGKSLPLRGSTPRGWTQPPGLTASQQFPGPKAFLLWAPHSSSFCSQEEASRPRAHPSSRHRPWALSNRGQTHLQTCFCLIPVEMLSPFSAQLDKGSLGSDTGQAQGCPRKHVTGDPPSPPGGGKSAGGPGDSGGSPSLPLEAQI